MEAKPDKMSHDEATPSSEAEPQYTGGYVPDTEEEKKLVHKIDMYILPCVWIMYLLSYMDRTK